MVKDIVLGLSIETNDFAFTYFVSPIESYISELLFPILTLINFVNY